MAYSWYLHVGYALYSMLVALCEIFMMLGPMFDQYGASAFFTFLLARSRCGLIT